MKQTMVLFAAIAASVIMIGCAGQQVSTSSDGTKSTNYVANTAVTQAATYAQQAAPIITAVVPQPAGSIAGLVVGALGVLGTAIAGGIAAYKNAQANLHQTTLRAVITGVENAVPGVQQVLASTASSGVAPANVAAALNQANAVLSAVKASVQSATMASGTATNLNQQLASAGIGPSAS